MKNTWRNWYIFIKRRWFIEKGHHLQPFWMREHDIIYGISLINTSFLFEEILLFEIAYNLPSKGIEITDKCKSRIRMKFYVAPIRAFEMYRLRYITSSDVSVVMVTCRLTSKNNVPGIPFSRRYNYWQAPAILSLHCLLFISCLNFVQAWWYGLVESRCVPTRDSRAIPARLSPVSRDIFISFISIYLTARGFEMTYLRYIIG